MDIKYMLACIFMSMGPEKHEYAAIFEKNEWNTNVFVDFESATHGKIDVWLICRSTY